MTPSEYEWWSERIDEVLVRLFADNPDKGRAGPQEARSTRLVCGARHEGALSDHQ
jgi:hypothetical protein